MAFIPSMREVPIDDWYELGCYVKRYKELVALVPNLQPKCFSSEDCYSANVVGTV